MVERSSRQATQVLLDQLILMLMRGALKAGEKLPDNTELTGLTHLTETELQSALNTLTAFGIVEPKDGMLTVVKTISESALNPMLVGLLLEKSSRQDLYELRLAIDLGALELAITKITTVDLEDLQGQLRKYQARMVEGDLGSLPRLDELFHLKILELSKNPLLIKIGQTVMKLFSLPLEKASRAIGPEQILHNHQALYEAIAAKDFAAARELVSQTFLKTMEYF